MKFTVAGSSTAWIRRSLCHCIAHARTHTHTRVRAHLLPFVTASRWIHNSTVNGTFKSLEEYISSLHYQLLPVMETKVNECTSNKFGVHNKRKKEYEEQGQFQCLLVSLQM
eukprot:scpid28970/ scgid10017/ 